MNGLKKAISIAAKIFAVFLIVVIIGTIVQSVAIILRGSALDFGGHKENNTSYITSDYIDSLDGDCLVIEVKATDVVINSGDKFEYKTNNDCVTVNNENGRITVKEEKIATGLDSSKLELTIPRDKVFSTIELSGGAGNITVNGLNAENLEFKLGVGDVTVNDLVISDNAEIDCGVGDFTVNGGAFNDIELNIGVGNATLNASGTADEYTVYVSRAIGDIAVDGKKISSDKTIGNGSKSIEVNGGMGNLKILFAN